MPRDCKIRHGGVRTFRESFSEKSASAAFIWRARPWFRGDIEVEIPPESRLDLGVLSKEELDLRLHGAYGTTEDLPQTELHLPKVSFKHIPRVEKLYLELPKPNFDDKLSDLERVYRAIQEKVGDKPVHTGLANIRYLGPLLRSSDWKVTVAVAQKDRGVELLTIEPGDTSGKNYGFVFDIGTTTISGQLIDLKTKKTLGSKTTYNRQATFGSDVITRIIYAQDPGGIRKALSCRYRCAQ